MARKPASSSKTKGKETGRPSKFKEEYIEQVKILCEQGLTDAEIAEVLKVGVTTLYRWKAEHPLFRHAIKVGKDAADDRVERSLFQNSIQGDTTAAIFWLKNRRRKEWQDGQTVKHELPTAAEVAEAMGKIEDKL